jgi:hypothetical protein
MENGTGNFNASGVACTASPKLIPQAMKQRLIKLVAALMRSSFAALLVTCLLPSLVPSALVVSAFGGASTMSCCTGKAAGHCSLALKVRRQPKPEPMCGAKSAPIDDGITVVADEADDSSSPSTAIRSIANQCTGDCSSCAVRNSKQLQRHKTTVVTQELPSLATNLRAYDATSCILNSHAELDPFSPRGPPNSQN